MKKETDMFDSSAEAVSAPRETVRKVYLPPVVESLGYLADLTKGHFPSGNPDGGGTFS